MSYHPICHLGFHRWTPWNNLNESDYQGYTTDSAVSKMALRGYEERRCTQCGRAQMRRKLWT